MTLPLRSLHEVALKRREVWGRAGQSPLRACPDGQRVVIRQLMGKAEILQYVRARTVVSARQIVIAKHFCCWEKEFGSIFCYHLGKVWLGITGVMSSGHEKVT
jgi:hypothetical protein